MLSLPEGSEKALYLFFEFPRVISKFSIEKMIEDNI